MQDKQESKAFVQTNVAKIVDNILKQKNQYLGTDLFIINLRFIGWLNWFLNLLVFYIDKSSLKRLVNHRYNKKFNQLLKNSTYGGFFWTLEELTIVYVGLTFKHPIIPILQVINLF